MVTPKAPAGRLAAAIVLVFFPSAARGDHPWLRLEKTAGAMGSTFSVTLLGRDRPHMEAAIDAALHEAQRLDRLLSNYQPASEWSRVNREAAARPVRVSSELFQLLAACVAYSRASEGAFDITVGPLMRAWGFLRDSGRVPRQDEVAQALRLTGYRHLLLDPAEGTVRFAQDGVELDPGGIGKGYAVDRMAGILRARGYTTALLSAGSSSWYGMGAPPEQAAGWRVTLGPGDAVVLLKDLALSTSGVTEKFVEDGGRKLSHVMDPRTGYPARGVSMVSVLAARAIDSEAWTKPYFVNGRAWATAHRLPGSRVFLCDDGTPPVCGWLR